MMIQTIVDCDIDADLYKNINYKTNDKAIYEMCMNSYNMFEQRNSLIGDSVTIQYKIEDEIKYFTIKNITDVKFKFGKNNKMLVISGDKGQTQDGKQPKKSLCFSFVTNQNQFSLVFKKLLIISIIDEYDNTTSTDKNIEIQEMELHESMKNPPLYNIYE
jgi:hypothetical protein